MAQQQTVGKHRTTVSDNRGNGGDLTVTYHSTKVVTVRSGVGYLADHWRIILDSGGYRTATTKSRMNQAANEYDLGFSVYQRGGKWFYNCNPVDRRHWRRIPFEDGIVIFTTKR